MCAGTRIWLLQIADMREVLSTAEFKAAAPQTQGAAQYTTINRGVLFDLII
jgi:hypothetical protein